MADPANQLPNTTLADAARGDGLHDFQALGPSRTPDRNNAFLQSIVGNSANNWTNEDDVLNAIFTGPNIDIRATLATLLDNQTTELRFATITGYSYNIKRVQFMGPGAGKSGAELASQINLDGCVLQVDFNHHGFLSRLKTGVDARHIKVGYIWSAATLNDPASKTPPNDIIFAPTNAAGVQLTAYQQTSGATLFPGGSFYNKSMPTKNFVSAYDVELSGITKKVSLGRREKDMVTLKFTSGSRTTTISDSKGQNSPGFLNSFISKLLGKARDGKDDFILASKWQQKRSGDWFQALHAALLNTMTFEPPLPPGFHTFFVSHDRIAIAYALAMGVPCIYFAGDSIYVFDNRVKDPAAARAACATRLGAISQASRQEMIQWFFGSGPPGTGHINGIHDNRNAIMVDYGTIIQNACDRLSGKSPDRVKSLDDIEKTIKTILGRAMKVTFLETALPDAGTLSAELSSQDPCIQYKGYATLEALYKQHGSNQVNTTIPPTYFSQFDRTMAYSTLTNWKIDPTTNIGSRIVTFFKGPTAPAEPRDAFTFFPFIQNSKQTDMKQYIANTFRTALLNVNDTYIDQIQEGTTQRRKDRIKMMLTNLYQQGHIYLQTLSVPNDQHAGFAQEFHTIASIPGIGGDQSDPIQIANQLTVGQIVASKNSVQEVSDSTDDPPARGGSTPQMGGWEERMRLNLGTEIDFSQCADPLIYALIEYYMVVGPILGTQSPVSSADLQMLEGTTTAPERNLTGFEQQEAYQGGKRRLLYGGVVSRTTTTTLTPEQVAATSAKEASIQSAAVVRDMFVLLVAHQLANADSYKLIDAPPDVMDYYTKFWRLVLALKNEPPSWELTRAMYAMFSHAAYMTSADFQSAFGMNEIDAGTLRLTCAASEVYRLIEKPTEPTKDLFAAKEILTRIWRSVPKTTVETPISLRNSALAATNEIAKRYTGKELNFQGEGVPLQPGVENPKTQEELKTARLAALTKRATKTAGMNHKSTRRKRRTTTP